MAASYVYEIQQSLNILAYGAYPPASGVVSDSQKAANDYAGTVNLELIYALNVKAGTVGQEWNAVCNTLNSSTGLEGQAALSQLAGGAVA
jgi:hypothetical protein